MTPLVPDWHLLKPKGGIPIVAAPLADKTSGTWTVEIRPVGVGPRHVKEPPRRTYTKGKGESLFTREPIPADWIKAKAQAGEMGSALYAVALKTPQGLKFRPPVTADLDAIAAAEDQLRQVRKEWEARNLIPTEEYPYKPISERKHRSARVPSTRRAVRALRAIRRIDAAGALARDANAGGP